MSFFCWGHHPCCRWQFAQKEPFVQQFTLLLCWYRRSQPGTTILSPLFVRKSEISRWVGSRLRKRQAGKEMEEKVLMLGWLVLHQQRSRILGSGDGSVVRAPDSWLKGRGFESLLERRENFLLQGQLSVLTLISVSVPPPCYCSST